MEDKLLAEEENGSNVAKDNPGGWLARAVGSERKRLLLLLFLCNMCLYINRANMSVAIVYMYSDDDGDKSSKSGLILSSFYWGYLVSQTPAGWLASRVGGKRVLLWAVGAWSVATLLVWPAYKAGVGAVVVSRMIVGMAEGANYPSQICLNQCTLGSC